MCLMCDQEGMFLEYLAYLHDLRRKKLAAGEDTAEIDAFLAENGYVNLDAEETPPSGQASSDNTDAPPTSPASPFSCDPADE